MERVTRRRALAGDDQWDDNGDPVPAADVDLWCFAVAPGASRRAADEGRDGSSVRWTVYFIGAVDLDADTDTLVVRGDVCSIAVNDWISPRTPRRGVEVLCTVGKG